MNVRDEIKKYAAPEDREILEWLFDRYHMQSSWNVVAFCRFKRYGKLSYETHRVWVPQPAGRSLFNSAMMEKALEQISHETINGEPTPGALVAKGTLAKVKGETK